MTDSVQTEQSSSRAGELMKKIESRTAKVGILGLGYVGLPLSKALLENGYRVIGFDVDQRKIDSISKGHAYIEHLGQEFFDFLKSTDTFTGTSTASDLAEADAILICVPTPLGKHNDPDLSYVISCTELIRDIMRPGQLIALESTTYPGTTRNEMMPILDQSGLVCGIDYFLAYSPAQYQRSPRDRMPHEVALLERATRKTRTQKQTDEGA